MVANPMWPDGRVSTRRLRGVLQTAADRSGWGKPLPAGWGRGIAGYAGFGSYTAYVVTVSSEAGGGIRVRDIVAAVDCGRAINPDGVKAMMEGAANFGLAATFQAARSRLPEAPWSRRTSILIGRCACRKLRRLRCT